MKQGYNSIASILIILLLTGSLLFSNILLADNDKHRVLVLHSYHQGYEWSDEISRGITETFAAFAPDAEIYFEYLDVIRRPDSGQQLLLQEQFKARFVKEKFEIIIVADDAAFNFALELEPNLFHDVPVVFTGVDNFSTERIKNIRSFTGIEVKASVEETVQLALRLSPEARRLAVISGSRLTERIFLQQFEEAKPSFENQVDIIYLTSLEKDELCQQLGLLQENDVILYLSWLQTPSGDYFSPSEALSIITSATDNRIFGIRDFTIEHGVIGGKMVYAYNHGEMAALIALDLLKGKSIRDITPMHLSPNQYLFNGMLLRKHGISEKLLPDNSLIIHKGSDYLLENWGHINEAGFISYDIFENHGVVMLLIDARHGVIIDANRAAFNYYQYPDLIGMNITAINLLSETEILAEIDRARRLRNNFFQFRHLLANGEERDVEVYSYPFEVSGNELLFSLVVDVTSRNLAQKQARTTIFWVVVLSMLSVLFLSIFIAVLVINIRRRVNTEKRLLHSEQRYKNLFNNVQDIVFSCDEKGRVRQINKAAELLFDGDAYNRNDVWELITRDNVVSVKRYMRRLMFNKMEEFQFETRVVQVNREHAYLQINGIIKYKEDGSVEEIFGIARNVTDQKNTARKVMKAIIDTQEADRKIFAEEIHEGIGPLLSGLKMYLSQDSIDENLDPKSKKTLTYSRQLLDDAINETRNIANKLMPSVLLDFGLRKALSAFIKKNVPDQCNIKLNLDYGVDKLSREEGLLIYRLVTELLNATLKYSGCETARISVKNPSRKLILHYTASGVQYDAEATMKHMEKGSQKLQSIFYRIGTMGGQVKVNRDNASCLSIKIDIPLE